MNDQPSACSMTVDPEQTREHLAERLVELEQELNALQNLRLNDALRSLVVKRNMEEELDALRTLRTRNAIDKALAESRTLSLEAELDEARSEIEELRGRVVEDKLPRSYSPPSYTSPSKPRPDLLPAGALLEAGACMSDGVERDLNGVPWYERTPQANAVAKYRASLLRHVLQHLTGEQWDRDSGRSHLAHVLSNSAILYRLEVELGEGIATSANNKANEKVS